MTDLGLLLLVVATLFAVLFTDSSASALPWYYGGGSNDNVIYVEVGESVQDAIDLAEDGWIVQLAPGVHDAFHFWVPGYGPSSLNIYGKQIGLYGTPGHGTNVRPLTTLRGYGDPGYGSISDTASVLGLELAGSSVVRDLVMTNGYGYGSGGVGVYSGSYGTELLIDNCYIEGNTAVVEGGGGISVYSGPVTFRNCVISGNRSVAHGNSYATGGGVLVRSSFASNEVSFEDCTISDNQGSGIYVASETMIVTVYGCSITHNTGYGVAGCYGVTIEQSVLCGNYAGQRTCGYGDNCVSVSCLDCDPCPDWPWDCSEDGQVLLVPVGASVQLAIDLVPESGTVLLDAGEHSLTQPLSTYGKAFTLQGSVGSDGLPEAILDGQGLDRILELTENEGPETMISDIIFRNGHSDRGGAMFMDGADPTIVNCHFTGNLADQRGGAMHLVGSHPALTGCWFLGNEAGLDGGALLAIGSSPVVEACSFSGNIAGELGGAVRSLSGSQPLISSSLLCGNTPDQISGNFSDLGGNCIMSECDLDSDFDGTLDCNDGCPFDEDKAEPGICGCGTPDLDSDSDGTPDCNDGCPDDPQKTEPGFCGCGNPDNDADDDGEFDCTDACPTWPHGCSEDGSILVAPDQSIQLAIDVVEAGGVILLQSGASYVLLEPLDPSGKAFTLGVAEGGTATLDAQGMHRVLECRSGEGPDTIFERVTFFRGAASDGFPDDRGGGVLVDQGAPTFIECTFLECTAISGGASANIAGAPRYVGCLFSTNQAFDDGGAVYNSEASPVYLECIFVGNEAVSGLGGAFFNYFGSRPRLERCEVTGNSAFDTGGGLFNTGSSRSTLSETTVCSNLPDQISGGWDDEGGNIVEEVCPPECPADLTGDDLVDGADLTILLGLWGTCTGEGDFDGNGCVDGADLTTLLGFWGACP